MREIVKVDHELAPCPYCGFHATVKTFLADYNEGDYCNQFTLGCSNDGWDGQDARCFKPSVTQCGPYLNRTGTRGRDSDQEAIEDIIRLWNQRVD